MAKIDNELSNYRNEIQRLTSDVYDICAREQLISQELRNIIRDVSLGIEQLANVSNLPDIAFDLTKSINNATNRARKVLDITLDDYPPQYLYNELSMDFDNDIPF
ncbi:hypothetical protein [Photobacterium damselae]|uniref:Uncharacterized protein n=1 Tax=Photobacterium damselae TaxID=38293 RepID=A0ABD6WZT3_PHODM|nr:hypothetical protein [Photobacterium damselae]OBU41976.1 hypothetical protein AYY27_08120 [Photobacterium damselae]PSU15390.1 hypothetical protein CTM90_17210 [Photobacterium damselae]